MALNTRGGRGGDNYTQVRHIRVETGRQGQGDKTEMKLKQLPEKDRSQQIVKIVK